MSAAVVLHTLVVSDRALVHLQDALDIYLAESINYDDKPPAELWRLQRQLHGLTGEALPPSRVEMQR